LAYPGASAFPSKIRLRLRKRLRQRLRDKFKAETKEEAESHPETQSLLGFFSLVFFLASAFSSAFVLF